MKFSTTLLFSGLFLFSFMASAQTMQFCSEVNTEFECIGDDLTFYSDSGSIVVNVMIYMTEAVNTDRVDLKIYKMVDSVETLDATIPIDVNTEWDQFYKALEFFDDTAYFIYAYKADGTFLCSGTVDIYLWSDEYWWDY